MTTETRRPDDIKALFVRYRSSLSATAISCRDRTNYTFISRDATPLIVTRPFHWVFTSVPRSSRVRATPHHSVSTTMQRSFSDKLLLLFAIPLAEYTECNRPTAFTALPLLTDKPILLRPISAAIRWWRIDVRVRL
jgi:hypothetical protein